MLQVQATCEFNLATDKSIANTLFLKSDGGNLESTTWWLEPVDGEVKISGPFQKGIGLKLRGGHESCMDAIDMLATVDDWQAEVWRGQESDEQNVQVTQLQRIEGDRASWSFAEVLTGDSLYGTWSVSVSSEQADALISFDAVVVPPCILNSEQVVKEELISLDAHDDQKWLTLPLQKSHAWKSTVNLAMDDQCAKMVD